MSDPQQQLPPDPLTAMAAGAAQTHEMFMAYVNAGFSRPEALQIVLSILHDGIAQLREQQQGGDST